MSILLSIFGFGVSANDGIALVHGQSAFLRRIQIRSQSTSPSPVNFPSQRRLQGNGNKPPHANGGNKRTDSPSFGPTTLRPSQSPSVEPSALPSLQPSTEMPSTQPSLSFQPSTEPTVFCPLVNIALGKTTSQKSTDFGGVASRAVDGDTNPVYNSGSISHTAENDNPWWLVNLDGAFRIQQVVIWNRLDCCSNRLSGATVRLLRSLSTDGSDYSAEVTLSDMTDEQQFTWDTVTGTNEGIVGLYIFLPFNGTYLSLAEVEVFAKDSNCSEWSSSTPTNTQMTSSPSIMPSSLPSMKASESPSVEASSAPSMKASDSPSVEASSVPSLTVSESPSGSPSGAPSGTPSGTPTTATPTEFVHPTHSPTLSRSPSISPSQNPVTEQPTSIPSVSPMTSQPSLNPVTEQPTSIPFVSPMTSQPTNIPSISPITFAIIPTTDQSVDSARPSSVPTSDESAIPSGGPQSLSPILTPPFGDQIISLESSRPSSAPTLRPSLRPTITTVPTIPSYQFPKIALLLRGNQAIVSGAGSTGGDTRRKLDDKFDACDSLLLDLVRNRIRSEIISIVGFFETLSVELANVSKQYNVDEFTLAYTFDLEFEIRSPLEEHDLRKYVKSGFDSETDENFILQYLQAGECPVFAFASGFDIVVSSPTNSIADESETPENDEQIRSDTTSQTVLIAGSAAAAGAGIVLLGVFIAVKVFDRRNTQPASPMSLEGNFDDHHHITSDRDRDILSEIGVRTAEEVSTLGGNFPEAGSMESQQEEKTNESFSLNYEFTKPQNPSCSDASYSEHSSGRQQISTDDDTLGGQYASGEIFEVRAPSGLLGIVLETAKDGVPTVTNIRSSSVLANDVKVGDRLISVDGVDCFCLLATDISQMIARKQKQAERIFVFARPMNKEGSLSSIPEN